MKQSKLRPKVVLGWGIGLTLAGVLLSILVPQIGYAPVLDTGYSAAGVDRALIVLVELAVRIADQVLMPLGVALVGASVVMAYLRALSPAAPEADHRTVDQ